MDNRTSNVHILVTMALARRLVFLLTLAGLLSPQVVGCQSVRAVSECDLPSSRCSFGGDRGTGGAAELGGQAGLGQAGLGGAVR